MNYAKALALAQRLIAANGREIKLQRLSGTPANAAKPWEGAAAPTVVEEVIVTGVFVPHAGTEDLGKLLLDEELAKRCEQICLVPGGTYNLANFTVIEDEGTKWRIELMRELKPGSTTVLYVLGVKR